MEATLTAEWIKKMCFIYINTPTHTHIHTNTHSGILLSNKKERNNDTCSNIDAPEIIILSEVNQRKTNII